MQTEGRDSVQLYQELVRGWKATPLQLCLDIVLNHFQTTFECIVKAIRASCIIVFSHWYYIDTNTFWYINMPLVDRYSCYNITTVKIPLFTYTTVFNPYFRILGGQRIVYYCILYKDCRMWFNLLCMMARWSITQFCTARVDEIISRLVP